ncbi:MAG: 2-hydroxychromene-2-carboxylate isomerase [Pseudomonadota bacterium]|nr:2-hydroxychromene-2-carboxylate isomerase [Pseudomonadota bacterium]
MTEKVVEFFWDVVSPYTYLAATQMAKLKAQTGAEVRWRPFLLGGVFKATRNQPPANLPAKAKYMPRDLQTWAAYYDVPFAFPSSFPANTLLAMRGATLIEDADKLEAYALGLFAAHWERGEDISQPGLVAEIASAAGLDGEALVARAGEQEAKDRLRRNTEEAVERGAFGAPTFFVGEQLFWGNDRLPLIYHVLGANR